MHFACLIVSLHAKGKCMRVLIVNTSEKTGGAALAANRLMEALKNNGVKAMMLVRDKETDQISVAALSQQWRLRWSFLWERWCVFWRLHFRRKHLFDVDIANTGADITKTREFQEADIIHLHWINQGMLSLKGIRRILESGNSKGSALVADSYREEAPRTTSLPVSGVRKRKCSKVSISRLSLAVSGWLAKPR